MPQLLTELGIFCNEIRNQANYFDNEQKKLIADVFPLLDELDEIPVFKGIKMKLFKVVYTDFGAPNKTSADSYLQAETIISNYALPPIMKATHAT